MMVTRPEFLEFIELVELVTAKAANLPAAGREIAKKAQRSKMGVLFFCSLLVINDLHFPVMTPCDPIIAASFAYHFPVLALFPGKEFCEFLSES
jgi:hypothetical protein